MWWCLIFDFTFSIFACFCCFVFSFLLSSSSSSSCCFRVFVLHIICVIRESFMFPLRMTHGQRITPFRFFFLFSFFFFLFFAVFAVYRTLIWIEIDTEFGWTYHRTELDVDLGRQSPELRSPVGGNKANEGVAQLSWMSVTDHREVSVWFEDLQIFWLSYLSLSLSLSHTVFLLMKK